MPKQIFFIIFSTLISLASCSNSGTEGYTLSGNVISGGTALSDVTISVSHPRYGIFTVKTDSSGNFLLPDLWDGIYEITPQKDGLIFEPANATISIKGNISQNFTGITTWNKIITGSDSARANDVKVTSDGGYILAGYIDTPGNCYDFWVIKLDKNGAITWEQKYGSGMNDFAYSVIESFNGAVPDGYVIAGKTETIDRSYDAKIIKINTSGTIIWEWDNAAYNKTGYDELNKVVQTPEGGYILTGQTKSCDSCGGFSNAWILKLDRNGLILDDINFGGDDSLNSKYFDDYAYDICKISTGGYAVIGGTKSYQEDGIEIKGLFLKYNSALNPPDIVISSAGYYEEEYKSINQTSDGGFIITGYAKNRETDSYDLTLIKTNSSGTVSWRQLIDGLYHNLDKGYSVIQTSDGGYAVAGETFNASSDNDMALFKFDSNGNLLWKKIYSNMYNDSSFSLKETADQGYVIAGYSESALNHDVIWLLKTDRNGIIYGYNDNE